MKVTCCKECPFFAPVPILGDLIMLLGSKFKYGTCLYDAARGTLFNFTPGLPPGPERDAQMVDVKRRLTIMDNTTIPDACPLRTASITIEL